MQSLQQTGLGLLALALPGLAQANAGIPMIVHAWPLLWLALPAVVALEAALAVRWLGLAWRPALRSVLLANLASTLAGIPLAWFLLALGGILLGNPLGHLLGSSCEGMGILLIVLLNPAWPGGICSGSWELLLAFALLLLPFGLVSHGLEWRIVARRQPQLDRLAVRAWSRRAHLLSYALLLVAVAALSAWQGGWVFAGRGL